MQLDEVARLAAAHGVVTGVLAAESADGEASYLVAFGSDDAREWLLLDAAAQPVADRARVREVSSLVAMCELAAEAAGTADVARIASPAYLDAVGGSELAATMGIVEAFVGEVEARYKLPLR
jgi:hypothetical protein